MSTLHDTFVYKQQHVFLPARRKEAEARFSSQLAARKPRLVSPHSPLALHVQMAQRWLTALPRAALVSVKIHALMLTSAICLLPSAPLNMVRAARARIVSYEQIAGKQFLV